MRNQHIFYAIVKPLNTGERADQRKSAFRNHVHSAHPELGKLDLKCQVCRRLMKAIIQERPAHEVRY